MRSVASSVTSTHLSTCSTEGRFSSPAFSTSQNWSWCRQTYEFSNNDWGTESQFTYEDSRYFSREQCSCCGSLYRDDYIASDHIARDDEQWIFEPYRDFRSAARAKYRYRRIRENKGKCNSYRGRKQWQAEQRTRNKKKKREKLRFAICESQKEVRCYTRSFYMTTKHALVEWDTRPHEELDNWITSTNNNLKRYAVLNHGASRFEALSLYIEVGESFGAWCQPRIAEMRSVKEARIRRNEIKPFRPMILQRGANQSPLEKFIVYTGNHTPSTTLPIDAHDALGHMRLDAILTLNKCQLKHNRRNRISPFRAMEGYGCFGEHTCAWHWNMSECWEIGHGESCTEQDGEWDHAPMPCSHCCEQGDGSMFYECYCRNFGSQPAPKELQRCSLIEWVQKKGKDIMVLEERIRKRVGVEKEVTTVEVGGAWEFLSRASSETWSVVDEERTQTET